MSVKKKTNNNNNNNNYKNEYRRARRKMRTKKLWYSPPNTNTNTDNNDNNDDDILYCWLVFDDEEIVSGKMNHKYLHILNSNHVIKTDSSIGLTNNDVRDAMKLWYKQMNEQSNQIKSNEK